MELHRRQQINHEVGEDHDMSLKKSTQQFWRIMELPELSLAPTGSSSSESETNSSRKRKLLSDNLPHIPTSTNVDLHLKGPLPMDWEQCLDLQSGRMYYFNRKTLRKSWSCPKDQKQLDLELNISTHALSSSCATSAHDQTQLPQKPKKQSSSSSTSNMVALACLNCHLLVILSKSFPSCPNCKYVHSLPTSTGKAPPVKSLDTLSLLN